MRRRKLVKFLLRLCELPLLANDLWGPDEKADADRFNSAPPVPDLYCERIL